MQAVSAAPAHEMLQRKERADNHSTRKTARGASSVFASYAFGPMDTKGGTPEEIGKKGLKAIQGSAALHNPLAGHTALAVTAQQADTGSLAAKAGVNIKA